MIEREEIDIALTDIALTADRNQVRRDPKIQTLHATLVCSATLGSNQSCFLGCFIWRYHASTANSSYCSKAR